MWCYPGFGYERLRAKAIRCGNKLNIAILPGLPRRIIRYCASRGNDCWAVAHRGSCPEQPLNRACSNSCAIFATTPIRFVKPASCRRWLRNLGRAKPLTSSGQNRLQLRPVEGSTEVGTKDWCSEKCARRRIVVRQLETSYPWLVSNWANGL